MVGRTTRCSRIDTLEPEHSEVEFIDENVNHPNRVLFGDVIIQALRQQRDLRPGLTLNEPLMIVPATISTIRRLDNRRCFHTAWVDSCRSRRTVGWSHPRQMPWSNRMQTGGQVGCKRLVKSGAISQPDRRMLEATAAIHRPGNRKHAARLLDGGTARDQWNLQERIPIPSNRQKQYSQGTLPSLAKLF